MKQFAQCDYCQQWYVPAVTMSVEVQQGLAMYRTTIWCYRCVAEAEQRSAALSQSLSMLPDSDMPAEVFEDTDSTAFFAHESCAEVTYPAAASREPVEAFQQCIQEHLALMERALHEDDAILGMTVETFLQRCRALQEDTVIPEQLQRLQGCVHYWETFLRALNQGAC